MIPEDNDQKIELGHFLKLVGMASTGGQAKLLIQDGQVQVNGEVETRRRRKLVEGDRVLVLGQNFEVKLVDNSQSSSL